MMKMINGNHFCIRLVLAVSIIAFVFTNVAAQETGAVWVINDETQPVPVKLIDAMNASVNNAIEVCLDSADCFAATSLSFGATQSGTMHVGGGGGAGKVSVQDIFVSKIPDHHTPILVRYASNGQHLDEVTINYYRIGESGSRIPYMKFTISPVLITQIQLSANASRIPVEEVAFNFAKYCLEVEKIDAGGQTKGTENICWNIEKNVEE